MVPSLLSFPALLPLQQKEGGSGGLCLITWYGYQAYFGLPWYLFFAVAIIPGIPNDYIFYFASCILSKITCLFLLLESTFVGANNNIKRGTERVLAIVRWVQAQRLEKNVFGVIGLRTVEIYSIKIKKKGNFFSDVFWQVSYSFMRLL